MKWEKIGEGLAGDKGMPGSSFRDCTATMFRRGDRFRVTVRQRMGSNQGRLEVHHSRGAEGRGDSPEEAVDAVRDDVLTWADGNGQWEGELSNMLREAVYGAEDFLAEEAEPERA